MKKNIKYILLSFFIPFLFILIYTLLNTNSIYEIYIGDLGAQYINLFDYLLEVFKGNQSIIYSFNNGLGGSMYGAFFYYLSSPLNIFLIFANSNNIHIFIIMLIFIKIGLCGLTMYIYLLKNKNLNNIYRLVFSTSYALMTFNIIYYFCTMWLDVIYLAPIILLFLDKILENKKSYLYTIFLFISIVSNYYMSYILCIFLVIYFIFRILTKYNLKKDKEIIKKIIIKFIIHSLLAGLFASFMILPILDEMSILYRNNYVLFNALSFNLRTSNLVLSLGIIGNLNQYHIPYFFPGFFVLVVMINYFLFVKDKDKKIILIVIFIFIISVMSKNISFMWHAFTNPMSLEYRFAPYFVLFLIIIASEKINFKCDISYFKILILSLIYYLINVFCISLQYYLANNLNLNFLVLINCNLLFFIFNFVFLNMYDNKIIHYGVFVLLIIEIFINFKYSYPNNTNVKNIYSDSNNNLNSRNLFYENINNLNDNYRIGGKYYASNTEAINTKANIEMFLSNNNSNIKQFYSYSGYTNTSTYTSNNINNIVINKLLGVKYWYNEENKNFEFYKHYDNIDLDVYIDNNALSLGYMIDNNYINPDKSNPFDYINSFTKLISNVSVYEMCDVLVEDENNYKIINYNKQPIYVWTPKISGINSINGNAYYEYLDNNIIVFDNILETDEIIVNVGNTDDISLYAATINEQEYNNLIDSISEELTVTKIEKNTLEGYININSNKNTFMLTVPYTDNFELYVDGQKENYEKIFDTFVGINLDKGYHNIKLVYKVKYLKEGIILSIVGIILSILYFNIMSKNVKMKNLFDKTM